MTETPEHPTAPTSTATPPPPPAAPRYEQRPGRLSLIALWVAIVAGVVFTVAVIFFSGFTLGRHTGGGGYHHMKFDGRDRGMVFHRIPPMGPMGPMGPGPWGPWERPAPGGPGAPGQPPQTTAPTPPSPTATPRP